MSKCYHHYRIDYQSIYFHIKPFFLENYNRSTTLEQNENIYVHIQCMGPNVSYISD